MKKRLLKSLVITTILSLMLVSTVSAATVSVYKNLVDFSGLLGVEKIAFPEVSSLPLKPWNYDGYSCVGGSTGISLADGDITIKNANSNAYICILGPDWNASQGNINPWPIGPTIVANGEDDYDVIIDFAEPVYGVGFELLTNSTANETITLSFTDGTTKLYNDIDLGTEPNAFEFVGFKSSHAITRVKIDTTGGAVQNEGITGIWVIKNLPPSVEANGPYSGEILSVVHIDGNATDPNNDPLTHNWTVNNNHCSIEDPTSLSTNVICSDVGIFTLTLTVSDGQTAPVSDTATIKVTDPYIKTKVEDCVPGTYERYNLVETTFVNSHGSGAVTPVITSTTLNPAAKYLIEASGIYYAGGSGVYDIRADAKYNQDAYERYNYPNQIWSDSLRNYDSYGPELLDLKVDGDYVDWGDYNPEHTYTIEKSGTGSSLSLGFQIYDIYAQNNTGGLCVAIYEFENEAPVADPGGPYLIAVNTDLTFDGTGSFDPEDDPITYVWDFGDSITASGETPTHSYATAGIYDVCLTVNDGYVDSETACTMAVVYDPSSGFVTGGGWIISPEGAYTADPSLTGKATFGFVAKYKKGTTIPDGNTEFQFKTGDLNFKSTSYEWLVIAGTKAQYKGEGSINGQGNYKFMITADDNSTDTFRIKIWTEVDGVETIVYDNGSQQALGGGSIVIHK